MTRKTPRKTMAEIRAEERARGFQECLEIFEAIWREKSAPIIARARPPKINAVATDPVCAAIWEGIEKGQKRGGKLDDAYKALMFPRVYGKPYETPKRGDG